MSALSVTEHAVEIRTPEGIADAWLYVPVAPAGEGAWPAVIHHTDIRGVRDGFRAAARRLAAQGHVVLLPNLYYRAQRADQIDPGLSLRDEAGRAQLTALRQTLTADGEYSDHVAFLDWLATLPSVAGDAVGIVGYCMSGAIALRAAANFPQRIVAAASFHGGGLASDKPDSPHRRADRIRARLYLGYAHDDGSMPPERIAELETALREAGVSFDSEHYPARHGFAVTDSPAYERASGEQHFHALLRLFDSRLRRRA